MKRYAVRLVLLNLILVASSFKSMGIKLHLTNEFPVPEGVNNLLFYVQRTINANTIVYTLNINEQGDLNEREPIKVFWIKYAQGGKIDPLTYIQRNYAYGIKVKSLDKEKKSFQFEFVSYNKRRFYLIKSPADNQYHVYGFVNNKLTIINNIMVKIEGGSFWVPNVKTVEVVAKDPNSSDDITEIIKP